MSAPQTLFKFFYYLGRFDHLLCVPALWYFSNALRDFCRGIEKNQLSRAGQI